MLLGQPIALWITGVLALYMAWAIGANDVANAMGTSVGPGALNIRQAIIIAGVLEFCGAFFVGAHVTETVRQGILDTRLFLNEHEDLLLYGLPAALASAATSLLGATRFGLPVSTTHILAGSALGVGLARGIGAIDLRVVGSRITVSRLATLPIAAVLSPSSTSSNGYSPSRRFTSCR